MKVYIIIDCCSGEDYSTDDPTLLAVTTDEQEAKDFFNDEIDNWEDGMEDYESNVKELPDDILLYECTDFEGDSHRIMKLYAQEIE